MKPYLPPFDLVYQIFPDRFAIGTGESVESKFASGLYPDDAVMMRWNELPKTSGRLSLQHFGGDLDGIAEKVPYLKSLGVDAVYITPIHNAPSYHRYDATDYRSVDQALGGMAAFDRMLAALHESGIRLIIDLVLNHLSSNHPFFIDALRNPSSKYRNWFYFNEKNEYQCWWGADRLPELNLENDEVIQEFVTGENSVLRFWINKGVDGFRLDCANDLGVNISSIVTDAAKKIRSDVYIIGETFHYGADWIRGLDAIQCYYVTNSILHFLNREISARQFGLNAGMLFDDAAPHGGIHASWNMLSSHDFPRPLTTLKGDKKKLELALLLQFTLPGIPSIYYGDETGMTGGNDPANRAPMQWDSSKWDSAVGSIYARMLSLRKSRRELRDGDFHDMSGWLENGVVAFMRTSQTDPRDYCIVLANPFNDTKKFTLFVPAAHMFSDIEMVDLSGGARIRSMSGSLHLEIGPMRGAVLVPDYDCKKRYRFSKRL